MTASQIRNTVWAVLVFFFLIGFGVFAVGLRLWFVGHQATEWPRVSGHLVTVDFLGANAGRGASRVHVVYDYISHGQTLRGDRVCFGFVGASERQRLAQMQRGDLIEVSVDSQDASRSVLFPGTAGVRIFVIGGIVVVAFVTLVACIVWRDPPWKLG